MSIAKLRLFIVLLLASFALVGCDMAANNEENPGFEGPPIVRIAAPLAGDTYREGVSVDILVRVENAGPDIARVAIQVDGEIVGEASLPNSDGQASFTVQIGWTALGVGSHSISAVASRADTTVSEPANVSINVVASPQTQATSTQATAPQASATTETNTGFTQPTQQENSNQQAQATNTQAPPPTAASTNTSAPPPATATPSRPMVNVTTGANIRSGPSQAFNPPIGSLAVGATAPILAVNTDGTWYKIQYYNSEGWIFASTVSVTGDISGLPREAGPPTPVPATAVPTAVPVTQAPPSTVDLIIDGANSRITPSFRCGQSSEIRMTVVNRGTTASPSTIILVQDIEQNGSVGATTQGGVKALAPNESTLVIMNLTISTNMLVSHTFRATVDGNNTVPESNESNNLNEYVYVLERGNC
jgi:uncharacterized protein YraI